MLPFPISHLFRKGEGSVNAKSLVRDLRFFARGRGGAMLLTEFSFCIRFKKECFCVLAGEARWTLDMRHGCQQMAHTKLPEGNYLQRR